MTEAFLELARRSDAVVAALGTTIFPLVPPEKAPQLYAIYQLISDPNLQTLQGGLNFYTARLQFNVWGARYVDVGVAARAVRKAVVDFRGVLSDGTFFHSVVCDSFDDDYDSVPKRYGVRADYIVMYSNPA